jgi:hypothetical protein
MASAAELTEKYISEHPSIKDCLGKGVINYSKLSRNIAKDIGEGEGSGKGTGRKASIEAILVACRRYARRLRDAKSGEDAIIQVLRGSELEIRNKVVISITDKNIYGDSLLDLKKKAWKDRGTFYAIEGSRSFTLMFSERYAEDVEDAFKRNIQKTIPGLAMIVIKSPVEIETTPGILGYLYSKFADRGINISQTMSCHTDTIFVISESDVPAAMKFLKF